MPTNCRSVVGPDETVCAYVPVGAEPGSLAMVDRLRELCARVLLPVTRTGDDGRPLPLLWGEYVPGALVVRHASACSSRPSRGWRSDGRGPASVVLVPALAVDRRGVRLGRGGGFYDRSLSLCRPDARLIAVVRDDEIVEELPSEAHDVRMTHALTPRQARSCSATCSEATGLPCTCAVPPEPLLRHFTAALPQFTA